MGDSAVGVNVGPDEPRDPHSGRLPARGTKTTLIQKRQLRLYPGEEKPWLGRPDDHRDRINVEQHGDVSVVFRPSVGAVSALSAADYLPFHVFVAARGDRSALTRYFVQTGEAEQSAEAHAGRLADRLARDGWTRTELPTPADVPLSAAYFTVTRHCDRACPYCYQGLSNRGNTEMTVEEARLVLDRIRAVNHDCALILSGGEPFSHGRIHEILDLLDEYGFRFSILSNGTFVDETAVRHLKNLKGFMAIQISLDGASAETHEFTRGKGHFAKVMAALQLIFDHQLAFKLAPTLHNGNLHELPAIAELAVSHGGWLSPNPLVELPHAGLNYTRLEMSRDRATQALRDVNDHLVAKFGRATVAELASRYRRTDPKCGVPSHNAAFVCGFGLSIVDVDWNGDIYPCHLAKGPELCIGNIFNEDFASIFRRMKERGIRVMSHEIEKCSGCKFVSTCGGGCRASAYFMYGTLQREDVFCDVNYASHFYKLLARMEAC